MTGRGDSWRLEVGDLTLQECPHCGNPRGMVWTAVFQNEVQVALDYAFLYDHDGDVDVFQDVILGSWTGDESGWTDHTTFSTHTRFGDDGQLGSMLLDGGSVAPDGAFYGRKVDRDDALDDPRLPLVWRINDAVLDAVPAVRDHLAGEPLPAPPAGGRPGG